MSVSYRLISASELDSTLIEAWRSIQAGSGIFASPYFCPEFTQMVGRVRDDVRVVVIENGGRPVGFFPHQRSFLGMGKPVGGPFSDYHGVIINSKSDWELDALMRAARLSVWTFDHLVGGDEKFEKYVTARDISPQADLSAGYERYVKRCRDSGSDEIMQAERKARKLDREVGAVHFTLHEATNEVLKQLISWKREQYRQSKLVDAFCEPWTGELLRHIAHTQTPEFSGVCSVLRVGDRIVAAHMGMRSRHTFHHWFPAYLRDLSRFSPGNILLLRMAQALADSGVHTIDFGKGGLHWKRSFMTGTAELREGFVELPSLLTSARRLRRVAEARAAQGGTALALRLPLKVIRRIEWIRRFR